MKDPRPKMGPQHDRWTRRTGLRSAGRPVPGRPSFSRNGGSRGGYARSVRLSRPGTVFGQRDQNEVRHDGARRRRRRQRVPPGRQARPPRSRRGSPGHAAAALPSGPAVMSPKVSSPNSKFCGIASLVCFKSAARAGGGMGAPVMFQQVGCGEHPCNAGAGGRAGPVFGQGGAQSGSILPAASCNLPNLPSGLISSRERGQIVQSGVYKPQ